MLRPSLDGDDRLTGPFICSTSFVSTGSALPFFPALEDPCESPFGLAAGVSLPPEKKPARLLWPSMSLLVFLGADAFGGEGFGAMPAATSYRHLARVLMMVPRQRSGPNGASSC